MNFTITAPFFLKRVGLNLSKDSDTNRLYIKALSVTQTYLMKQLFIISIIVCTDIQSRLYYHKTSLYPAFCP